MDKLSHGIHCGNFAADSLKLFFFLIYLFDGKRLRERERASTGVLVYPVAHSSQG